MTASIPGDVPAVVARHIPAATLRTIEPLAGGVSAAVFRLDLVTADNRETSIVLRAHGPTHHGLAPTLEFALLNGVAAAGLPVPKPICVDTSCKLIAYPYLLMPFVEGASGLVGGRADAPIGSMADMLAAVHRTPIEAVPSLPARRDPVPGLLDYLPTGPEWRDMCAYLTALGRAPYDGPSVLLHGDFWPENLIWRDRRIAAILDWEDAGLGDPLSDVAGACLELRYVCDIAGMDRFRQTYAQHRAIDPNRLALWQAYVAAAALRFMGGWGLEPAKEAHMRRAATDSLREAGTVLLS